MGRAPAAEVVLTNASFENLASRRDATGSTRPLVSVQGLGFVGAAMAVAVAAARDGAAPSFDVVGLDVPSPEGEAKVAALNAGNLPVPTSDSKLVSAG